LVLAPHTDDGEFGCGGTIAKLTGEGHRVLYAAFSAAEQSVLPQYPPDILRHEVKDATKALGIYREDCLVLDFHVRNFPAQRQDILEEMVRLNKEYAPEMVFMPSLYDTHQDHAVIAGEGFRAFKKTTLFGYEVPWNNLVFKTSSFFALTERELQTKGNALKCYLSQQHRDYATEEFVRGLAVMRGTQVGQRYAEAFEVIRLLYK
jgi:LmbE family N-acetylglucosaminyl deacetylase